MTSNYFIGLMSGTSLDGVDVVLVDFSAQTPKLLASHMEPFHSSIRSQLLELTQPGDNEIDRMGQADVLFADMQAAAVRQVLSDVGVAPQEVRAIGSHGQTIRHRPELDTPFTLQIGDPTRLAEQLGIDVVADFRRRDVAAGGQGAPLVPAFHEQYIRSPKQDRVVLNIGGMANVTLLYSQPHKEVIGYDTGPGNVLMDAWIQRHLDRPYDLNGAWAQTGNVDAELLDLLMSTPYLDMPPPKSTGRELFHLGWLLEQLERLNRVITPVDVQATLLEFTALTIAQSLKRHEFEQLEVFLCGGGAHNQILQARIQDLLPGYSIQTTDALGLPREWLEACAFAWLAKACIDKQPGNLPSVTGAKGRRVLGAIYQA